MAGNNHEGFPVNVMPESNCDIMELVSYMKVAHRKDDLELAVDALRRREGEVEAKEVLFKEKLDKVTVQSMAKDRTIQTLERSIEDAKNRELALKLELKNLSVKKRESEVQCVRLEEDCDLLRKEEDKARRKMELMAMVAKRSEEEAVGRYKQLEKVFEDLKLEKVMVEEELKSYKRGHEKGEDKFDMSCTEVEKLQEMIRELSQEMRKKESESDVICETLKMKLSESEERKNAAEKELEGLKKRYAELESRNRKIEEDYKVIHDKEMQAVHKVDGLQETSKIHVKSGSNHLVNQEGLSADLLSMTKRYNENQPSRRKPRIAPETIPESLVYVIDSDEEVNAFFTNKHFSCVESITLPDNYVGDCTCDVVITSCRQLSDSSLAKSLTRKGLRKTVSGSATNYMGGDGIISSDDDDDILSPKRRRFCRRIVSDSDSDDDGYNIHEGPNACHTTQFKADPLKYNRRNDYEESVSPNRTPSHYIEECELRNPTVLKSRGLFSRKGNHERMFSAGDEGVTKGFLSRNEYVLENLDKENDISINSGCGSLEGFIVHGSEGSPTDSNSFVSLADEVNNGLDSDDSFSGILGRLRRRKRHDKWAYEGDMLASFQEDDDTCLKAVCALYRRQTSDEQEKRSSLYENGRGFNKTDASRASDVAEFLIESNQSAQEIKEQQPELIKYCKELVRRYSKQLFQIYQSGEDPSFHP